MAALRELRKRLKSVRATGQLAGAMRTVAAAKFSRANAARTAGEPYVALCRELVALAGAPAPEEPAAGVAAGPRCAVLLSSNRGLCGGFNTELMALFFERYRQADPRPLVIACGRMAAAFCREKGIPVEREFTLSDIPTFAETHALTACLRRLYEDGAVSGVDLYCQRYGNMLRQTPACEPLLPPEAGEEGCAHDGFLFLPDRETVSALLARRGLDEAVFSLALEHAAGAQAATLMAMRNAFDNAEQSALELETTINRRRQAQVTASIIETAADTLENG